MSEGVSTVEDLQSILEKINREGVEKAEASAAKIINEANKQAEAIISRSREEAAKMKAAAERDAEAYATRAKETIRQASRDTIVEIRSAVTTLLNNLLTKDVSAALSDETTVCSLVSEAIKNLTGNLEIAAPEKLASALKAQLASQPNITVVLDENIGTGFAIRTEGGRVEHEFTAEVIAAELARRLRPDLAALMA